MLVLMMVLSQVMVLNHMGKESDPHWRAIYESLRTYNHFVFFFLHVLYGYFFMKSWFSLIVLL